MEKHNVKMSYCKEKHDILIIFYILHIENKGHFKVSVFILYYILTFGCCNERKKHYHCCNSEEYENICNSRLYILCIFITW